MFYKERSKKATSLTFSGFQVHSLKLFLKVRKNSSSRSLFRRPARPMRWVELEAERHENSNAIHSNIEKFDSQKKFLKK